LKVIELHFKVQGLESAYSAFPDPWQFMMVNDQLFHNIGWCFLVCCLPFGTDFCETLLFHTDNVDAGKAW